MNFDTKNSQLIFHHSQNELGKEEDDTWVFGLCFLNEFPMFFDYEDKSVVFYSQYKILLREDNLNIITYLYLSNIVLLASFSLLHLTIWSKLIFLLK